MEFYLFYLMKMNSKLYICLFVQINSSRQTCECVHSNILCPRVCPHLFHSRMKLFHTSKRNETEIMKYNSWFSHVYIGLIKIVASNMWHLLHVFSSAQMLFTIYLKNSNMYECCCCFCWIISRYHFPTE